MSPGRREIVLDDGVSDRLEEYVSRKSKSSSDSKSGRKDRESGRLIVSEEEQKAKHSREIIESNTMDAEPNPQHESQIRRKYGSGDGDQHLDDVGDAKDGHFSLKDEKYKEERYGDKYREDSNGDSKHRDDHLRDDKDMTENQQKKSKPRDHDRKRETVSDRDHVRDHYHEHESERERDRDKDRNRNRDNDCEREQVWNRDRERGRERNRDRDREAGRGRERDYDHDGSHPDDRRARYKDSRGGRERSPDD